MLLGRVVGNVWSTRKDDSLIGIKLMVVQLLDTPEEKPVKTIVAADLIGAGVGEMVILTIGSSARKVDGLDNSPIDATIVGIVDENELEESGDDQRAAGRITGKN
ncbi:MAG: EutN/CcmL family microcompartment protein [Clostridiales bacterium]|jgi:ethanolamine utilization protein EutN|nr:EutN/CcmL family microcompartment protein [Clostridiales bacterium]